MVSLQRDAKRGWRGPATGYEAMRIQSIGAQGSY
jgi:hypothetical protein